MQCPYSDCRYEPESSEDQKFKHIRTAKEKSSTLRGWLCPNCGRSFIETGKLKPEPYYTREKINFEQRSKCK